MVGRLCACTCVLLSRAFLKTFSHISRIRMACHPSAYACAWQCHFSTWMPCHTVDTCVVSRHCEPPSRVYVECLCAETLCHRECMRKTLLHCVLFCVCSSSRWTWKWDHILNICTVSLLCAWTCDRATHWDGGMSFRKCRMLAACLLSYLLFPCRLCWQLTARYHPWNYLYCYQPQYSHSVTLSPLVQYSPERYYCSHNLQQKSHV